MEVVAQLQIGSTGSHAKELEVLGLPNVEKITVFIGV